MSLNATDIRLIIYCRKSFYNSLFLFSLKVLCSSHKWLLNSLMILPIDLVFYMMIWMLHFSDINCHPFLQIRDSKLNLLIHTNT
jgi:hypothetical protein